MSKITTVSQLGSRGRVSGSKSGQRYAEDIDETSKVKDAAKITKAVHNLGKSHEKFQSSQLDKSGLISDKFSSKYFDELLKEHDTEQLFDYTSSRMEDIGLLGYIEDLLQPMEGKVKPTENGLINLALNLDKEAGGTLSKEAFDAGVPAMDYIKQVLGDEKHASYEKVFGLMGSAETNAYEQLLSAGYSEKDAAQIMHRSAKDIKIVPNINPFGFLKDKETTEPSSYGGVPNTSGTTPAKEGIFKKFKDDFSNWKNTQTQNNNYKTAHEKFKWSGMYKKPGVWSGGFHGPDRDVPNKFLDLLPAEQRKIEQSYADFIQISKEQFPDKWESQLPTPQEWFEGHQDGDVANHLIEKMKQQGWKFDDEFVSKIKLTGLEAIYNNTDAGGTQPAGGTVQAGLRNSATNANANVVQPNTNVTTNDLDYTTPSSAIEEEDDFYWEAIEVTSEPESLVDDKPLEEPVPFPDDEETSVKKLSKSEKRIAEINERQRNPKALRNLDMSKSQGMQTERIVETDVYAKGDYLLPGEKGYDELKKHYDKNIHLDRHGTSEYDYIDRYGRVKNTPGTDNISFTNPDGSVSSPEYITVEEHGQDVYDKAIANAIKYEDDRSLEFTGYNKKDFVKIKNRLKDKYSGIDDAKINISNGVWSYGGEEFNPKDISFDTEGNVTLPSIPALDAQQLKSTSGAVGDTSHLDMLLEPTLEERKEKLPFSKSDKINTFFSNIKNKVFRQGDDMIIEDGDGVKAITFMDDADPLVETITPSTRTINNVVQDSNNLLASVSERAKSDLGNISDMETFNQGSNIIANMDTTKQLGDDIISASSDLISEPIANLTAESLSELSNELVAETGEEIAEEAGKEAIGNVTSGVLGAHKVVKKDSSVIDRIGGAMDVAGAMGADANPVYATAHGVVKVIDLLEEFV